jgi:uncharacterized protein (TIGR03435 family)
MNPVFTRLAETSWGCDTLASMSRIVFAAALLATGLMLYAQPVPRRSFEVVSIKPSRPGCAGSQVGGPSPGRLDLPCVTVRTLIGAAYVSYRSSNQAHPPVRGMPVIGGPAWLRTDRYDISAKAEGRPPFAEMLGPMLQTVLEDRFQLKIHIEPKGVPVYSLVVAKGGAKLRLAEEGSCIPFKSDSPELYRGSERTMCGQPKMTMKGGMTILEMAGTTMEEFASHANLGVERPVVDATGLSGRYDVHLEFASELNLGSFRVSGGVNPPTSAPSDAAGPSVFTALPEQLGLRLIKDNARLDVLVIDSVQRPTAN